MTGDAREVTLLVVAGPLAREMGEAQELVLARALELAAEVVLVLAKAREMGEAQELVLERELLGPVELVLVLEVEVEELVLQLEVELVLVLQLEVEALVREVLEQAFQVL